MNGYFKSVSDKGFGWIRTEGGKDYFCHKSCYKGQWHKLLEDVNAGDRVDVTFEPDDDAPKGPRADNVRRT